MVKGGTDMKNMKYILIAVAAMASAACAKEITPEPEQNPEVNLVPMTFTASADDDQDTKVFYDRETKTTQWKEGDKIMVISSTGTATEFEATSVTDNGKTATFKGLTENADTYYAVSPASAYKGNGQEVTSGTLYVNIPEVQTAVAGTFDPAAFVSVAKNDGGHLGFKNSCSIVRFNLKNPEGVKSVRFTANDVSNLAGTQNVSTSNIPSHSWGSAFEGRTSHDMITLNAPAEGFKAETDYYMTMRPQTMAKGINLYIEYADAVKVRKGTSEFPASMNTIRDLKTLDEVTLEDITPYESYQMGFDLNIAGEVINKETYETATLISDAGQTITATGLYFVDPTATDLGINNGTYTGYGLFIIGNTSTGRINLNINGTVTFKGGLMNLNIVENCSADLFKPAKDGNILLDNCHFTTSSEKSQIFYSSTSVNKFSMHNCDIKVAADGKQLWKLNSSGVFNTFELVNNIFYAAAESGYQNFNVCQYGTITNLVYQYNTMAEVYNAYNGSVSSYQYFSGITSISDIQFNNNLFYLTKYAEYANSSYSSIIKATTYPTSGNVIDNVIHWTKADNRLKIVDGTLGFEAKQTICSSQTNASLLVDVSKTNIVNGIVVPTNKYGATR